MQTDHIEERIKMEKGYAPKESYSFHKYLKSQKQSLEATNKFRTQKERSWNDNYIQLKGKNAIMRMDMINLRERLKPYTNEGFNHKDRKTT